jgi:hypothetical protein
MECGQVKAYRIRCRNTGLFSNGGETPRWGKFGKVWRGSGALRNHLRIVWKDFRGELPVEWEVVEYELVESRTVSAREF